MSATLTWYLYIEYFIYESGSCLQLKRGSCESWKVGIQQARLRSCSCFLSTELAVSKREFKPFQRMKIAAHPVLMSVVAYCSASHDLICEYKIMPISVFI